MLQSTQIELGHRLFDYIDQHRTATGSNIYQQPIDEYINPQTAQTEREVLFRRQPLCVGLSNNLPSAESYFTHDHSGQPILLTRDGDHRVRGFLNVCRHRGARLADGCGTQKAFSCPYHAWRYDLKGCLQARPEEYAFAGAPRDAHGLAALDVREENGLLWVMPQAGLSLPAELLPQDLNNELASFGLDGFKHYRSCTLKRRMNWKLLLDTFLESYHFCVLHKNSICSIFYDNLTAFDTWGAHFRLVSARRNIEQIRHQSPQSWNLLPYMVGIYILFPNTVLVWQLDHIELWQIFPSENAPDESQVLLSLYTPEEATSEKAKEHWDKNLDLVVDVVESEDFPVGEAIQRGFYANAQQHILFGTNEPALQHFHHHVSARLKNQ